MPSKLKALLSRAVLDRIEQFVALALYVWLVARLWPDIPILFLLSEGLVVFFLIIRKPTGRISIALWDWAVAAGGTFLVLLVAKGGEPIAKSLAAYLLVVGFLMHVGAKLSLRRSFGLVAANRGVQVGGMYRYLRHPMYAGYMLTHIGFLLLQPSFWNLTVYLAAWSLFVARVFAEERTLSLDPAYRDYSQRVRYRMIPGVF